MCLLDHSLKMIYSECTFSKDRSECDLFMDAISFNFVVDISNT